MFTQSAWKALAVAAGGFGLGLLLPLNSGAADTGAKAAIVQPISTINPVQVPVVKAPAIARPKPDLPPVIGKPIAIQPIAPGPIAVPPARAAKPDVSPTPITPKIPTTPIGRVDPIAPAADGGLTSTLMEYQKDASKEARDDRNLAREGRNLGNAAKAKKLKLDNDSIRNGTDEARAKAGNAMDAAQAGMATSIGSGAVLPDVGGASNPGGGDVEVLVQTVLQQTSKDSASDLKQMASELKDKNAAKTSLRAAKNEDSGKQDRKGGKTGRTDVPAVKPAAGPATPKTSLTSRPCTPINPC